VNADAPDLGLSMGGREYMSCCGDTRTMLF